MSTPMIIENRNEIAAIAQSRIDHLEDTILELYQSVCPIFGTIDFAQEPPENFVSPFSQHTMQIPHTKLSINLITNPPRLNIGNLDSNMRGPLQWEHELTIHFPIHTIFVKVEYGIEAGDVRWLSNNGSEHQLPTLPTLTAPDQTEHYFVAHHEGIISMQITSRGKMVLNALTVGISSTR